MKIINLKDFYRSLYEHDFFCEVADEVAELLILFRRREDAQRRQVYRKKAYYSLDREDGLENTAYLTTPSAESIFIESAENAELQKALKSLPDK